MTNLFHYVNGRLHCEETDVETLVEQYGSPLYIYSQNHVLGQYRSLNEAFAGVEPTIFYSMKANPNLSLLKLLNGEGCHFEVVSEGEIRRAMAVGIDMNKVMYAGVGKTPEELDFAIANRVHRINVENPAELAHVNAISGRQNRRTQVSLRVNPDVDPKTHAYTATGKKENKFGMDFEAAGRLFASHDKFPNVDFSGLHCHLGSGLLDTQPYTEAIRRMLDFKKKVEAHGVAIRTINTGGGFGIQYKDERVAPVAEFGKAIAGAIQGAGVQLCVEPGRYFIGNAAICVGRVLYIKDIQEKRFVIQEITMNEIIRPSFYGSYHKIWPARSSLPVDAADASLVKSDIVGPICESGDFIAKDRSFPPVQPGELIAVFSAGAYCSIMASNYNSRNRPAEVMVNGKQHRLIRDRESYPQQMANELACLQLRM